MIDSHDTEPDYLAMGTRLVTSLKGIRKRQRRRKIVTTAVAVGAGSLVLAGSFVYVQSDYERRFTAECFTEASLSSASVASYMIPENGGTDSTSRITLAADACAASWRAGVIGQPTDVRLEDKYPVPSLLVCEDRWGALKVFPVEDQLTCVSLSLKDPTN